MNHNSSLVKDPCHCILYIVYAAPRLQDEAPKRRTPAKKAAPKSAAKPDTAQKQVFKTPATAPRIAPTFAQGSAQHKGSGTAMRAALNTPATAAKGGAGACSPASPTMMTALHLHILQRETDL